MRRSAFSSLDKDGLRTQRAQDAATQVQDADLRTKKAFRESRYEGLRRENIATRVRVTGLLRGNSQDELKTAFENNVDVVDYIV